MSYFPFLYDYDAVGLQDENLDSKQKRLFDRSTRPEKRDVYIPDPITVGTPLEPLSHFIDAADTLGIFNLFKPKAQNGGDIEFYDDNRNVIESVPMNEFFENYNAYKDMISRQKGGSVFEPQVELNIDPNAFPSTNPVIDVQAAPRMSNRQFYDAIINADTAEEMDAIVATDKALSTDIFGNPVGIASTKQMDLYDNLYDELLNPIIESPFKFFGYDPIGDEYDADVKDDMEFVENLMGYKRQQMGGSAGGRMTQAEALLAYNEALEEMKIAREAFGSNDTEMLRELGTDGYLYGPNNLVSDWNKLQRLRKAAGLGVLEDFKITLPHVGQMIRGGYNQMLGTNFQFGGPTVFPSPFPIVDASAPFSFVDQDPLEDTTPLVTDEPFEMTMTNVMSTENPNLFPQPGDNPFPLVDTYNPYTLEPSPYSQETIADEEEETEEDELSPFGKFSNAAVSVARGMNQIALRKQQREAERLKRMNLSADNLFGVSDPLYERGTFDVNTGIAQSDNLVPYLPMGEMGMEVEADEEMIRKLIAAGAQIKF